MNHPARPPVSFFVSLIKLNSQLCALTQVSDERDMVQLNGKCCTSCFCFGWVGLGRVAHSMLLKGPAWDVRRGTVYESRGPEIFLDK